MVNMISQFIQVGVSIFILLIYWDYYWFIVSTIQLRQLVNISLVLWTWETIRVLNFQTNIYTQASVFGVVLISCLWPHELFDVRRKSKVHRKFQIRSNYELGSNGIVAAPSLCVAWNRVFYFVDPESSPILQTPFQNFRISLTVILKCSLEESEKFRSRRVKYQFQLYESMGNWEWEVWSEKETL